MTSSGASELPTRSKLVAATAIAVAVVLLVIVAFVLPAEYGKDPTGIGKLTGVRDLYGTTAAGAIEPGPNATTERLLAFNVSWASTETVLFSQEGQSAAGEVTPISFTVPTTNVTRVTAVLSWSDEQVAMQDTAPDTFELNLTGPGGETRSFMGWNEGPSGTLTALYVVNSLPNPVQVLAKDEESARQTLQGIAKPRLEGTGDWMAQVRLVEAGGVPFLGQDEGNAWTLRIFVQAYSPILGAPEATLLHEDEVRLTIPAQGDLEWKLRMNASADMSYTWTASGAVAYDFHGDHYVGGNEKVETYETGNADDKSGTLKAPFTGRHGWYWVNDGLVDVQLTLKVRGDYAIIGVV
ncbi:MAG: hypothetical protein ACYC2H_00300 [Thermoplasmatota archaeon]